MSFLNKVKSGDPMSIPAAAYNSFVDAAIDLKNRQNNTNAGNASQFRQTGIVLVRNQSGADRDRSDILGVNTPIITESVNHDEFLKQVAFDGVVGTTKDHTGRFAILLQPIPDGMIGLGCVDGICSVLVRMEDESHHYADINPLDPTNLLSAEFGSAYLLWVQPPAERSVSGIAWTIARIGTPQQSATRYALGQITAIRGTADSPRYDAVGVDDQTIQISNQVPRFRTFDASIKLTSATVGSACLLFRNLSDNWKIGNIDGEKVPTDACQPLQGAGTPDKDVVISSSHAQRDRFKPLTHLDIDVVVNINAGTTNQYGHIIYTFPPGNIQIRSVGMNLTVSSPSETRKIKLALATNDATGKTGTVFAASEDDVVLNGGLAIQLSPTGNAYERLSPDPSNVTAELANLMGIRSGSAGNVGVYLNIAQNKAAGWLTSDTVRVEGSIDIDWVNMGGV